MRKRGERGFALVEIVICTAILAVLALVIMPAAGRLYRTALLAYETHAVMSDIRYVERLARTTTGRAAGHVPGDAGSPRLILGADGTGYDIVARGNRSGERIIRSHSLAGPIRLTLASGYTGGTGRASIAFDENGVVDARPDGTADLKGPGYTLALDVDGHPAEGERIVIDAVGRVRVAVKSEE